MLSSKIVRTSIAAILASLFLTNLHAASAASLQAIPDLSLSLNRDCAAEAARTVLKELVFKLNKRQLKTARIQMRQIELISESGSETEELTQHWEGQVSINENTKTRFLVDTIRINNSDMGSFYCKKRPAFFMNISDAAGQFEDLEDLFLKERLQIKILYSNSEQLLSAVFSLN